MVKGGRFAGLVVLACLSAVVFPALARQPIASVRVEGVRAWEKSDVLDRLRPLWSRGWDDADTAEWKRRLEESGVYYEDVRVERLDETPSVHVRVVVRKRPRIAEIEFEGNETLPRRRLYRPVRTLEGQPVESRLIEASHTRLAKLYEDEGFPNAEIFFLPEPTRDGFVKMRIQIREGPQDRVRSVEWVGDWPAAPRTLARVAGLEEGARWTRRSRESVRRSLESWLQERGFLAAVVKLTQQRSAAGAVELAVQVNLGPKFDIRFRGNRAISEKRLRGLVRPNLRRVVGTGLWERLRQKIREAYENAGYFAVQVHYEIADEGANLRAVTYSIVEGPRLELCAVHLRGVREMPVKKALHEMERAWSRWAFWRRPILTEEALDDALRRLWFLYYRAGYLQVKVLDRHVLIDTERRCIDLTVFVSEGPQVRVEQLEVTGWPAASVRLPELETKRGAPLDEEALERDRVQLQQTLINAGYWRAAVEVKRDGPGEAGKGISIAFIVSSGGQVRAKDFAVTGNFETRTRTVLRAAGVRDGETVTPSKLERTRQRLTNLGVFRGVEVGWDPLREESEVPEESLSELLASESAARVEIQVTERPPYSLNVGGGYNTRDGFRAFAEVASLNLAHRAARLALRGDVALDPTDAAAPNEYLADLSLRLPQAISADWTFRSSLLAQRSTRSIDQFSIERIAFVPALEWQGRAGLIAGLELQAESARIFNIQPDVRAFNPADEGRLSSVGMGPFLIYDRRDDPFFPSRGWTQNWRLRLLPDVPGTEVPLVKIQWLHGHYLPLWSGWTAVIGLRAGWAKTLNGAIVPLRERFFLGGRSTVRGFSENSIGPLGAPILDPFGNVAVRGGNPIGGDLSLNSNLELRFPLIWDAIGVLFLDGGGVYLQSWAVDWHGYRRSAGLGLLYRTPVGPLALHWGFKLDRRRGEDLGAGHFSIGFPF
jgi:outer membrane protein insertion porin family